MTAVVCVAVACSNNSNTTYTPSSDPTISMLSFTANDSFPALAKAVFAVEERIDTGLIFNVDSLAYGTRIDSVVPKFTFSGSVVSSAVVITPEDTIYLSGKDTIDFSKRPVYIHTVAEDGSAEKWYEIQVNVHSADPDLYVWEKVADEVLPAGFSNQRAVIMRDTMYLFADDGLSAKLYYSVNGKEWTEKIPPFTEFDVKNTLVFSDKIYCMYEGEIKRLSSAKSEWQTMSEEKGDMELKQLVFAFNNSLWAIARSKTDNNYYLATIGEEFAEWKSEGTIATDFPISDFAALSFLSPTGRQRGMLVGGFDKDGKCLNTRWNVEYAVGSGYKWENFSIEQPSFSALAGVSIVYYDKHFLMFGGVDEDNKLDNNVILESFDEGMNWSLPDSTHNKLPMSYRTRAYQSALTDSNNNIYLIGGKSRTEVFSDVYKGRLNSINW